MPAFRGLLLAPGSRSWRTCCTLQALPDAPVALWLVRGLGTAILHGATAAIIAMIGQARFDRRQQRGLSAFLPGFALAVALHSASNHLLLHPVAQTLIILMILPAVVIWVFDRSERATREWVSSGLDLDLEVLQLIVSEHFAVTRFGEYLRELRDRFPGPVVADMYCLLRLELELAIQAKALIMARGAGLQLPADDDLEAALGERQYLQGSIGLYRTPCAATSADHHPPRSVASSFAAPGAVASHVDKSQIPNPKSQTESVASAFKRKTPPGSSG